jgi:hypothetical protein
MLARAFKIISISVTFLFIQACSHPIEIVGKGDVWSTGGRTCTLEGYQAGLDNCSKNYVIGAYQETYYAEPRAGWLFDRWVNYCVNAPGNACGFDISAATVQRFWGQTVPPLQAVFTLDPSGDEDGDGLLNGVDPCPLNPNNPCTLITDTVSVDGKTWAQPRRFKGLSWSIINSVCTGGGCGNTATLNGFDMSGWVWASVDEMNELFNHYIGSAQLGPGPDSYGDAGATFSLAFYADGWVATQHVPENSSETIGWMSNTDSLLGILAGFDNGQGSGAGTNLSKDYPDVIPSEIGAWFYRIP